MKNDNEYTIENEVKDLIGETAEQAKEAEDASPITTKSDLLKAIHDRTEETPEEESAPEEKQETKQPEQPKETEKAPETPEPERRTHKQKRAEWWEKNKARHSTTTS